MKFTVVATPWAMTKPITCTAQPVHALARSAA